MKKENIYDDRKRRKERKSQSARCEAECRYEMSKLYLKIMTVSETAAALFWDEENSQA